MCPTEEAEEAKHLSFEESLAKELKLLVMKKLMESFADESFGRFTGELLGRMELIKMSTVSHKLTITGAELIELGFQIMGGIMF